MSDQTLPIEVIPLQWRHEPPKNLMPMMRGVREARDAIRARRGEVVVDGRPYVLAPPMVREMSHIMAYGAGLARVQDEGLRVLPEEWRMVHLRTAALADRVALQLGQEDEVAAAVQAAWRLQVYDSQNRGLVLGEWQPDAIHWEPALSQDPATGSRAYVRQEYPLFLQGRRDAMGVRDGS